MTPKCDFCSATGVPLRHYDSGNFATRKKTPQEDLTVVSVGAWAACPDCAWFIDADDSDGLALRSALRLMKAPPTDEAAVKRMLDAVKLAQLAFWALRKESG